MSTATTNPNAPNVIGSEWFPVIGGARSLAQNGIAWGDHFTATSTKTIDEMRLFLSAFGVKGRYLAEVFDYRGETCGGTTDWTFRPSGDEENDCGSSLWMSSCAGRWQDETGDDVVGTLYQSIDESTLSSADYLQADGSDFNAFYRWFVDSSGFTNTERPLVMKLRAELASFGSNQVQFGIHGPGSVFPLLGATWYWPDTAFFATADVTLFLPEINPFTGYPWTAADVQGFDGGTYSFVIRAKTHNPNPVQLQQAWMEVTSILETRHAFACDYIDAEGWNGLPFIKPDGTDNWAKVNGTEYEVSVRRVVDPILGAAGDCSWAYLDSHVLGPHGHAATSWLIDGNGCPVLDSQDFTHTSAFAVQYIDSVGGIDDDSQPYALLGLARVDTDTTVAQEYSNSTNDDYGRIRIMLQHGAAAVEPLTLRVRRRSDNAQLGSAAVLTVADADALEDLGNGWRTWDTYIATPATLVAATQYFIEATSDATTGASDGWSIAYLDTGGEADGQTYGGTTDRATVAGSENDDYDLSAVLAIQPDAPTGFAVTTGAITVEADGTDCFVNSVDIARVTWVPTTLVADFGWYSIERSDDGIAWCEIAHITTEAITEFQDKEALRGIESCYRISVARLDGTLSIPTTQQCVTRAIGPEGALYFTSNELPSTMLVYSDTNPRKYEFLDATQIRALHDRDGLIGLRPTEDRGVHLALQLTLNAITAPSTPGYAVFQPLIDLARAAISYVCVLDSDGNRWYGILRVSEGDRVEPGALYVANIDVYTGSSTPSAPDIAIP